MPATSAPTVDDIRTVVGLATLAPSVHNSQPWHFRWNGTALDVREDLTRSLPVLDPTGRERLISCGAAVLYAELALAELGWAVRTELLPADGDDAVLARLVVTGRCTPTDAEHALLGAVVRRATDRDPYDTRPVPLAVLDALRAAVEIEGGWLRVIDPDHDEVALDVLLSRADAAQRRDPAYLAELAAWRTDTGDTGVPTGGLPHVPPAERASTLALRDFDAGTADPQQSAADEPPSAEHPAVVVLGTDGDSRLGWLVAGRATGRLLLTTTVEGLAAQPLTAVLEVPAARERLRSALGALGRPQMVLRLGYGTRGPVSHRLPVEQVLDVVDG